MRRFVRDIDHRSPRPMTEDSPADLPEGSPYQHVGSYPTGDGSSYVAMQDQAGFHVYKVDPHRIKDNINRGSVPTGFSGGNTADRSTWDKILYRVDQLEQAVVVLATGEAAEETKDPYAKSAPGQGESTGKGVTDRKATSDSSILKNYRFGSKAQATAVGNAVKNINSRNKAAYKVN